MTGFVADPGTNFTVGEEPTLVQRLTELGDSLGVTIFGISGYRTPAQSVAVGGSANDPHTQGAAVDIGVNSSLRSSAAQISEAELAKFGLYRPFDPGDNPDNTEVNHIQLVPNQTVANQVGQQILNKDASTPTSIPNPLTGAAGAITSVWNSAVSDAKYAGLLLLVLIVGAFLMVKGVTGSNQSTIVVTK